MNDLEAVRQHIVLYERLHYFAQCMERSEGDQGEWERSYQGLKETSAELKAVAS